MNNQFDELTKGLAQSVTRRGALKKLGVGLAGIALACFGLANKAEAGGGQCCNTDADCSRGFCVYGGCCSGGIGPCCCKHGKTRLPKCSPSYSLCVSACRVQIGK